MFKVGEVISVPRYGVMKAVVTEDVSDFYVYYRIIKHRNAGLEGTTDHEPVKYAKKGETSVFELMVHGEMSEERYERHIAEHRNIFKRIKRKYNAIKRRVRD
mgnify:CR=1 FL=1